MTDDILTRVDNGIAVITLNRPARFNALTREMLSDLGAILTGYGEDPAVGCVVLTGAGKAFCSGGDVQVQAKTAELGSAQSPEERADMLRRTMRASELLHDMPKPTIAMGGDVAGAGL
jgi:2-(1,2-epoxy-1,2-dihydrophenyl)acetyl-CoA isomerase